jgi:hypothetical protein
MLVPLASAMVRTPVTMFPMYATVNSFNVNIMMLFFNGGRFINGIVLYDLLNDVVESCKGKDFISIANGQLS